MHSYLHHHQNLRNSVFPSESWWTGHTELHVKPLGLLKEPSGRTPDLEVAKLHIDPLSSHNEPSRRSGLHVKPISNREESIERRVILR
jgi:hypothetical protein